MKSLVFAAALLAFSVIASCPAEAGDSKKCGSGVCRSVKVIVSGPRFTRVREVVREVTVDRRLRSRLFRRIRS